MEAMLLSCTELALKDGFDRVFRLAVLEAYQYTQVLKERASMAVRLLITDHKLPNEVYHNDYNLAEMTESQLDWAARLEELECLFNSISLPGDDMSGLWEDHIDWLECVFDAATRRVSHFDFEDCIEALAYAFTYPEGDWRRVLPFPSPSRPDHCMDRE